jgi:hypothetical protein
MSALTVIPHKSGPLLLSLSYPRRPKTRDNDSIQTQLQHCYLRGTYMQKNQKQAREAWRTHGVYLTEACDACGRLLGPVRFTHRGGSGVWCSRACRDGVDHSPIVCRGCGSSLIGKRKDSMYCHRTCRMRAVRKQVQDSANIVNTPIQNTGVADAISGFGCGGTRRDQKCGKPERNEKA